MAAAHEFVASPASEITYCMGPGTRGFGICGEPSDHPVHQLVAMTIEQPTVADGWYYGDGVFADDPHPFRPYLEPGARLCGVRFSRGTTVCSRTADHPVHQPATPAEDGNDTGVPDLMEALRLSLVAAEERRSIHQPATSSENTEHGIDTAAIREWVQRGVHDGKRIPRTDTLALCDALDRQREELAGKHETLRQACFAFDRMERQRDDARARLAAAHASYASTFTDWQETSRRMVKAEAALDAARTENERLRAEVADLDAELVIYRGGANPITDEILDATQERDDARARLDEIRTLCAAVSSGRIRSSPTFRDIQAILDRPEADHG